MLIMIYLSRTFFKLCLLRYIYHKHFSCDKKPQNLPILPFVKIPLDEFSIKTRLVLFHLSQVAAASTPFAFRRPYK